MTKIDEIEACLRDASTAPSVESEAADWVMADRGEEWLAYLLPIARAGQALRDAILRVCRPEALGDGSTGVTLYLSGADALALRLALEGTMEEQDV